VEIFQEELKKLEGNIPQVASIYGSTPEEFSQIAIKVDKLVDALELNISCPHAMEGCGASIGQNPDLTTQIVKKVKKSVKSPVIVKLTPNVTDIVEIAHAAEIGGADALTLINSLGPGMRIDLETAKPVLSNRFGGMSGPAIKPVALRCVYQVHQEVKLPIMGVGGIMDYRDVLEFLYAGASCVQIGTAVMYRGLDVFREITTDLEKFMIIKGYNNVGEMVGLAHQ
jgi:dihydroorotate dehydrogenase (NAD+) catalytic subunit